MKVLFYLFFTLIITVAPSYALDITPSVTDVTDQRSTGQFFNNLEIKIRLLGDDAASVRGIKATISSAVDSTGRNILPEAEKDNRFEPVREGSGQAEVKLKLKNPARRATVVKEISGELQLFMPDKDPEATVSVKGFMQAAGKPLSNAGLSKAGLSVTVLTKKEYESLKKEEEQKAKDAAQKQGLDQAMIKALEGLFSGFFQTGENDLIFRISDPSENLIELEVADARGSRIRNTSSMKSPDLIILNYSEPVPADSQLRIFLKTRKSVVTMPLRLTDIALP